MKYSIIVCVYNGEKYIDTCLSSLLCQTYHNYEIIIVDDGSFDQTSSLLKKYAKKPNIRIISQKNKGLSMARNIGVQKSTGDFLLFVDIDDTVSPFLLETIENQMEDDIDLIKFNYAYTYDKKDNVSMISHFDNRIVTGEEAFCLLALFKKPFELAVLYAYRRSFFEKNGFVFEKGMYHEDYGLIPYVLLKSKKVKLLDDVLYYYYQSEDSITRNDDSLKTVKKANDIFLHSSMHKKRASTMDLSSFTRKLYYSYIANAVLLRYDTLSGMDKKEYRDKIRKNHIVDDLLDDTILRKIKKIKWKIKIR